MTGCLRSLTAILALQMLLLPTSLLAMAPGDAPNFNAVYVDMSVPEQVAAGEVFPVTVTMRNTGTATWQGRPICLRSVNPRGNVAWGTDYILIAQGTAVKPGEEYTFRSNLRAPVETGKISFQWQVCKDSTVWFGQTTPPMSIEVTPRAAASTESATPPTRVSDGKKVLTFGDFEYLGSFKPPRTVNDARGAFSESGLAIRRPAGGRDRLLMNYTHPTQVLFEIEIPKLVKIERGEHADLETVEPVKIWGPVNVAKPGEETISPNGGFAWNEATQTLIWTWYHGYKTGPAPPILGATRLSNDGRATSVGPWRVSMPPAARDAVPDGLYKSYWGGVISLPKTFADRYTAGRTLALGFGGYYSICGSASRGPALGVIADPDPKLTTLPVTPMLQHPHDSPAPRNGDYFSANCTFWSDPPESPGKGAWSFDDWCRAGVMIDTPAAHGYVAFVRLGTGRLGYDFGAITSAGESQHWYFYDPREMGEAATGRKQPWQNLPCSMTRVAYPLGRRVTGACFDDQTGRLYLCVKEAYAAGKESYPVVHVYGL